MAWRRRHTLGGAFFAFQRFTPQGDVQLSKQTTFITSPLAGDGLPNYALAILERQRDGVTPENNAACLFWRAIGPVKLSPEAFALVAKELGIEVATTTPLPEVAGEEIVKQAIDWVAERQNGERDDPNLANQPTPEELEELVRDYLSQVTERPWVDDDLQPLATLLGEMDDVLNLLAEATARPRFYSPPPNFLADPHAVVLEAQLPHAEAARTAVRALAARAMNRVAHRNHEAAWQDIRTCWRLGAHIGSCPTIVEKLVGIACRGVARNCTVALLEAADVPETLCEQILSDLNEQPLKLDMVDALGYAERLMFLDAALRQTTDRLGGIALGQDGEKTSSVLAIDPNIPLRRANEWYDRVVEAASIEERTERLQALHAMEADLHELGQGVKTKTIYSFVSRTARAEAIGGILISLMLPALSAAIAADDRDETNLVLARVAAALALYRVRTGEYPEALDELSPLTLAEVPHDPYAAEPFRYQRRGVGYLLYSVFENGADDGGKDFSGEIIDGEWVAEEELASRSMDESDLVIRVPRPPLRSPIESSEP